MPTTEVLKCPECAAPLEMPAVDVATLRCPYCASSVLLDHGSATARPTVESITRGWPSVDAARFTAALTSGQTIEAIRLYRQHRGGDLQTARRTINELAEIQSSTVIIHQAKSSVGWWVAGGLAFVFIGFPVVMSLLGMLIFRINASSVKSTPTVVQRYTPPPLTTLAPLPTPTISTPPPFAKELLRFGTEGIGPGQFKDARSIAVDGRGHIYVGEYEGGRVQVFDSEGHYLKMWYADRHNALTSLAANTEGTLIATIAGNIICYEGMTGRQFGQAQRRIDQWTEECYTDATFAPTGEIYALDLDSNIVVLSADGKIQRTIPAKRNTNDDAVKFTHLAVAGDGRLFTLDPDHGLFAFGADGHYINRFAAPNPDAANHPGDALHMGFSLAIDGQGRLYVGDTMPAIKVFDTAGHYLGGIENAEVCFGVAVNEKDEVVGCLRNRGEVRKYTVGKVR